MRKDNINQVFQGLAADLDRRHALATRTPRVLYLVWPRPLRIGLQHTGRFRLYRMPDTDRDTIDCGCRQTRARTISDRDLASVEAIEASIRALQKEKETLLKKAWRKGTEITPDQIAAMGAEDLRPGKEQAQ